LSLALDNAPNVTEQDNIQAVAAIERDTGIELSEGQRKAVLSALTEGLMVITGGPGTGKTTTINAIIGVLESRVSRITLCAPTGRAAKRMTETTGREAQTVHRLLEVASSLDDRRQIFNRNEDYPLETDVLIIDEASMMDILLTNSLLKAVAHGTRVIFVGDVDQLPSVGPGNVLKDLIVSECVTVVRLTEVFRQARESAIIMNAHRINRGEYPDINEKDKDFFFMRRYQAEEIADTILDLVSKRLPAYKGLDMLQDIQVLTPMRKTALGVASLNKLLQQRINPPSPQKREREFGTNIFREGDKVMQIKNNYTAAWGIYDQDGYCIESGEGIFNGDIGTILDIDEDDRSLAIIFDDNRVVIYEPIRLNELELAYAVTVHKSQGSEYRVVVIPVFNGPYMLLSRNLLYTAITRARELVVLVGIPEILNRMVDNNHVVNRYTALARRIQDMNLA